MKLGFVSAILPELSFEELIDFTSEQGFDAVEVACWPKGKAERRYAGVSHIDVENLDVDHIKNYCKEKNVEISALAYYPNTMDLEKGSYYVEHLLKVIDGAKALGIGLVNTFIGRVENETVEENLKRIKSVWGPIMDYANSKGIKIGIENCPMLFTNDEWPGGQNIMTSPHNWKEVFKILDTKNIGLNYDPSHMYLQHMDYLKPMIDFKDRLFHAHFKDITIVKEKMDEYGYFSLPSLYSVPKIPGHGDIDWGKFVATLMDAGFDGYACIEIEDRNFESTLQKRKDSLVISLRYLKNFLV